MINFIGTVCSSTMNYHVYVSKNTQIASIGCSLYKSLYSNVEDLAHLLLYPARDFWLLEDSSG